jgi:hypothetical protein
VQAARTIPALKVAAMFSWNPVNLLTRAPDVRRR